MQLPRLFVSCLAGVAVQQLDRCQMPATISANSPSVYWLFCLRYRSIGGPALIQLLDRHASQFGDEERSVLKVML